MLSYDAVQKVMVLGEGRAPLLRVTFSDPDKTRFRLMEYLKDDGRVLRTYEALEWENVDGIEIPKKGSIRDVSGAFESSFEIKSLSLTSDSNADFIAEIPDDAGMRLRNLSTLYSQDAVELDRELMKKKEYLQALEENRVVAMQRRARAELAASVKAKWCRLWKCLRFS